MWWSRDLCAQRTLAEVGPGRPSVLPVRCGLPRKVDHGSAFWADAGPASNSGKAIDRMTRRNGRENIVTLILKKFIHEGHEGARRSTKEKIRTERRRNSPDSCSLRPNGACRA